MVNNFIGSNSWFYSLSTAAQSIAALIGFLAGFVIFKLVRINELIELEKSIVKDFLIILNPTLEIHDIEKTNENTFLLLLSEGIKSLKIGEKNLGFSGYDRLRDLMVVIIRSWQRNYSADEKRVYEFLIQKETRLEELLKKKKRVYHYLNWTLYLCAPSVFLSIFLIPFGYFSGWYLILFFIITILLCLFAVGYTIYSVVRLSWI